VWETLECTHRVMGSGVTEKTEEGGEGKRDPSVEYRKKGASVSYNFIFLKLQISLSLLRVGPYFRPSWYGIGYKMEVRNLSSSDLF